MRKKRENWKRQRKRKRERIGEGADEGAVIEDR